MLSLSCSYEFISVYHFLLDNGFFLLLNLSLAIIFVFFFKSALAKQENMEMKLQEVQRNLEHSRGKVAQLEQKL